MKKRIYIKNKDNTKSTRILIINNFINEYLKKLSLKKQKIYCVIDSNLVSVFKKHIQNYENFKFISVKSNEKLKSISSFKKISEKLLKYNIDRNSILVAIGGGTVGDLCGFIACTLLRGVDYKLIPTTLLAQVDSSIGGKNGINLKYGKNLIGTFYHPSEIIIDTSILKSLPIREMRSGYAEIVKHSLINDKNFFKWLEKNHKSIFNLKPNILEIAIYKSIIIKLKYVNKDPYENLINKYSRAILNFGHTIGHSLETFYNYKNSINHGEAISVGMIVEAKLSNKLGYLSSLEVRKIIDHFKKVGLKIKDKNINNSKIYKILSMDKKNINNKINIILLKKIGESFFARNIEIKKLVKNLENI